MENKWAALGGEEYRIEDLGRPGVFLIPTKRLKMQSASGLTVEEDLHRFLTENFGAYTTSTIPSFGIWRDVEKTTISDECREYEVSFFGKERIPMLLQKLAEVAKLIGEDCIYVKAGQYAALVYPKRPSS